MDEPSINDRLLEEIDRITRARQEAIEKACETALAGGTCGVSVYQDRVLVDPAVPYGHIYYHSAAEGDL